MKKATLKRGNEIVELQEKFSDKYELLKAYRGGCADFSTILQKVAFDTLTLNSLNEENREKIITMLLTTYSEMINKLQKQLDDL